MLRLSLITAALLAFAPAAFHGVHGQMPVQDWTDRPDAVAPVGISDDFIPAPRSIDVRYLFGARDHEGFLLGTTEFPTQQIPNEGWEMVPHTMTVQTHSVEVRTALTDWLGFSARVPFQRSSGEFATEDVIGTVSAWGLGDVEVNALYGLHDEWPFRAHVIAGVLIPTGQTDLAGELPDAPGESQLLPYPMQPGFGTLAVLPGAVFAAENEFGTVGMKAGARVPIGNADEDWHRGTELNGQVWMAYRFSEWISGSVRLSYVDVRGMEGMDPDLDPASSPLADPLLQGGTRFDLPIGVNVEFPRGPLAGNRLFGELVVPAHQNLDGPQIRSRYGLILGWGVRF